MPNIYLIIVIVLVILAVSDLIVGVSNDAVNFLNSALGSKVASMKVIMIVAGLGVLAGATISGGMMEVARKGIFVPANFEFWEIMYIFLAVMITDIILLDTFNSFGMPTSTTVSIVFELLGAAVGMAVIKVYWSDAVDSTLQVGDYINSGKALLIIGGILLSVVVAFTVGMIIQFLTRMLFSFDFKKKVKYYGALWGGFALTAIFFFILVKGAKNMPFMTDSTKDFISNNTFLVIGINFVFWTLLLQLLNWLTKINIFKVIVLTGTFALAMAFAGNDLVNFIGVPIAAFESFVDANNGLNINMMMNSLAEKEEANIWLLCFAGLVMVLTLWFSKKAKNVIKTSLDLGRQDDGFERFGSSLIGRSIVRGSAKLGARIEKILPESFQKKIDAQFDKRPFNEMVNTFEKSEAPAFDLVRASVTLVVASILISIGTSLGLPLSTTYVTFMVAMGTSLADGAWGRESAVYRVSGVLSVIGGWFFTAFSAFSAAFVVVLCFYLLKFLGIKWGIQLEWGIFVFLLLIVFMLYKSHMKQQQIEAGEVDHFALGDEDSIDGNYIYEKGVKYSNRLFESVMSTLTKSTEALVDEDEKALQKSKNEFKVVFEKIKRVNNKMSNTMTRLEDEYEESGLVYIKSIYFLHEIALSNNRIVRPIYEYVANSHKTLINEQHEDIHTAVNTVKNCYQNSLEIINGRDYSKMPALIEKIENKVEELDGIRKKQVKRIKNKEVGTRNSVLFFDTVSEIRHLLVYLSNFMQSFDKLNGSLTDQESK